MTNLIAAVDIGGTKIAVGIVDSGGRVVVRRECPTAPERGPADGMVRIIEMISEMVRETGAPLTGIGFGSTGPIDPFTGAVYRVDTLPGWEGANLMTPLADEFHVPVALENDADAAVLGEAAFGAGRGAGRVIYVTISTGIGVGIVVEGKLYRGAGAAHPEIGHVVVEASGPLCYCGARGCWEAMAAGPAMAAWAKENGLDGNVTAASVCALARKGDPTALRAVEREGYYIGVGLANLVMSFCPDVIAVGGGVMNSSDLFLDRIREVICTNCTLVPHEGLRVTLPALGRDAGLVGAACAWRHRFQTVEEAA